MSRTSFDVIADFAALFPVEVISVMLGVPADDRQQIRLWADQLLHREPDDPHTTREGLEAGLRLLVYFLDLVQAKRKAPADDLIGRLIASEVTDETATHRLADDEIAAFAALLGSAGSETVTKLLGSAAVLFDDHHDEWRKVLDDPGKIPGAVEEVVRYWAPSQYQGRFSHAASTWHGVTVPEATPVLLITGAANRDEREYPDPDRFDIDREPGVAVGLGHGAHHCIGAALARLESRVALEEIRIRWPRFEVDHDGLRRVQMANVAGFSHVPFAVRAA
jgi:cytochrome P450